MSIPVDDSPELDHAGDITQKEKEAGILPSHGISLDTGKDADDSRPSLVHYVHHQRQASQHKTVKETLNAKSEYTNNEEDGRGEHRINQYIIKDEIGRGSFGAVHLAVDQYGKEYAVKEFSKSRLRKRAQSNILRRPHAAPRRAGHLAAGVGFNSPLHRHSASDIHNGEQNGNPLYLIKEEIAIMKKLDHPNLVTLIEVLDDPEEDSLYMVLEMCKKGVIMKVGLGEKSDPYEIENCRCWFRDLILGIEYLHAQGVVHRDIKPDNLLLTEDDVLKIVDFGVSEMFEKQSEMLTAKSAGSPAFLPPELCVTKHGDISGKAADIWSMGVSLYCLRFGKIPFERTGVLELYEAIKLDDLNVEHEDCAEFCDLMRRLLEKVPDKRITMEEIRAHPWVTKNGTDPLLSTEENTLNLVEPPSEIEVNHAITSKMGNLLTMMKAVNKFKGLVDGRKTPTSLRGVLVKGISALQSQVSPSLLERIKERPVPIKSKSVGFDGHKVSEGELAAQGVHHEVQHRIPSATAGNRNDQTVDSSMQDAHELGDLPRVDPSGDKGHAHDPLGEEPLFLGIGAGEHDHLEAPVANLVAESPTAADFSIYDTAYEKEVERIRAAQGHSATVYLTRRVDRLKKYVTDENMIQAPKISEAVGTHAGFKNLVEEAREKAAGYSSEDKDKLSSGSSQTFSTLASKIAGDTKEIGKNLNEKGTGAFNALTQKAIQMKDEVVVERDGSERRNEETS